MTPQEFIDENLADINQFILKSCPNIARLDDAERRLWILNDEGLYRWAKSEGVDL